MIARAVRRAVAPRRRAVACRRPRIGGRPAPAPTDARTGDSSAWTRASTRSCPPVRGWRRSWTTTAGPRGRSGCGTAGICSSPTSSRIGSIAGRRARASASSSSPAATPARRRSPVAEPGSNGLAIDDAGPARLRPARRPPDQPAGSTTAGSCRWSSATRASGSTAPTTSSSPLRASSTSPTRHSDCRRRSTIPGRSSPSKGLSPAAGRHAGRCSPMS